MTQVQVYTALAWSALGGGVIWRFLAHLERRRWFARVLTTYSPERAAIVRRRNARRHYPDWPYCHHGAIGYDQDGLHYHVIGQIDYRRDAQLSASERARPALLRRQLSRGPWGVSFSGMILHGGPYLCDARAFEEAG